MSEVILNLYEHMLLLIWQVGLISNHYSRAKQEMIERIKSMVFLCMYCNSPNPVGINSLKKIQDLGKSDYKARPDMHQSIYY